MVAGSTVPMKIDFHIEIGMEEKSSIDGMARDEVPCEVVVSRSSFYPNGSFHPCLLFPMAGSSTVV
jgi:hypothetical protein